MTQKIARFQVMFGLSGCYMPTSSSAQAFSTRREFADAIRNELEVYDMPACLIREANIRRAWRFIQQHGSSSCHITLHHNGYALEFAGLTEDEYKQNSAENDY